MAEPPASSPTLDAFTRLRSAFFERYLQTQPEEATTLGLHTLDDRLKDCSPAALEDEASFHRDVLARLEQLPPEALPADARLDRLTIASIARFHVHSYQDLGSHRRNIELSAYPHAMLQYQIGQAEAPRDWSNIARRAARIPLFLQQQAHNLSEGLSAREALDASIVQQFTDELLPAIVRFFEQLPMLPAQHRVELEEPEARGLHEAARSARDAFEAHRHFLRDRLLPQARASAVLGEDEYRWRLENVFGITAEPEALVRQAEDVLARMQTDLIHLAQHLGAGLPGVPSGPSTMAHARALLSQLESAHPSQDEEVIPLYRRILERAEQFIRQQRMFRVPESYELGMKPIPPGMVDVRGTNWPAPLLDPSKKGWFVVAPEATAHPIVWTAVLAVHEGVPGHFLQSLVWQRAFSGSAAPVRFLLVTDHVAMARSHFGPMLNIEGYATYAEELMRRTGFYSASESLAALVARALRAVRVVVDVSLHTGRMSEEAAVRYLLHNACMPEDIARREVLRYKRIPLQAITYLLGALEIERLREDCRQERGPRFDEARFHDELFSFGPVPPALIRKFLLSSP